MFLMMFTMTHPDWLPQLHCFERVLKGRSNNFTRVFYGSEGSSLKSENITLMMSSGLSSKGTQWIVGCFLPRRHVLKPRQLLKHANLAQGYQASCVYTEQEANLASW